VLLTEDLTKHDRAADHTLEATRLEEEIAPFGAAGDRRQLEEVADENQLYATKGKRRVVEATTDCLELVE